MKKDNNNLMIVCVHILEGKSVYHQTGETLLCKKCFNHYHSYGCDKNGCWKIPRNENFPNLKTLCRSCVNQIVK